MSTPANETDALTQLRTAQDALKAMITERDTLQGKVTALTTERDTAAGQVAALTKERDDLNGQVGALTKERDDLKGKVSAVTTERDTLKAEATTVAAALAKHGITPNAVPAEKPAAGASADAKDAELLKEYEAAQGNPKALSALFADKDKSARLRAIAARA